METQTTDTSFDAICERSLRRHHEIRDIVLKGLKISHSQPGQAESELQELADVADKRMVDVFSQRPHRSQGPGPVSAEYFAECWDHLFWDEYKRKHGVTHEYPAPHPVYEVNHDGSVSPEHFRILESKNKAREAVAGPSKSPEPAHPSPGTEVVQEAIAQSSLVVRPVREHLSKARQDRVLPLQVRQEIWEKYFPNCKKQEGTEPLQLQIPQSKTCSLLAGRVRSERPVTNAEIFDRLRRYLPCGIDIVCQNSSDRRFGFTLLYIGLIPELRDEPQAERAIIALHGSWATLWPWVHLVNEGYKIDIAKFAQWHTKNEIETRQQKALDMDSVMAEALAFVEKEHIPRNQSVAQSRSAVPHSPCPGPGQHQDGMSTDRGTLQQKLSAARDKSVQDERVKVALRVATIIMECRVGTDGTALDWEALGDKLSHLVVESGQVGSRPRWIQESCSEWRKQNLAKNSREQVIFDRELNSWYSGILDFVRSHE